MNTTENDTVFLNYTDWYNYVFQGQSYSLYQGFIILEFLCIIISLMIASVTLYLIVRYPQFHPYLTGLSVDMIVAYFIIAIGRIVLILAAGFNPFTDYIDYTQITYYIEYARFIGRNTLPFIILMIAIERSTASYMLKTYADKKNRKILCVVIISPWILFVIINCLIHNVPGSSTTYWLVLYASILIASVLCLVLLHFFNKYRYARREIILYNLSERMQLSENIRFLKIVKWYMFTMSVGITLFISVYIWGYVVNGGYSLMLYTVLNFIITFNGILLPVVTIITVPVWKQKFVKLIKLIVNRSANQSEESA